MILLTWNIFTMKTFIWRDQVQIEPLPSKSSAVNSFNLLQSSKVSSNSTFSTYPQRSFAESVLKSSNPLFPSGTIFTEKRFYHLPRKSQVLYLFQYNISHLFHLIHIIDFFLQFVWQSTWKILIRNCQMYMQLILCLIIIKKTSNIWKIQIGLNN